MKSVAIIDTLSKKYDGSTIAKRPLGGSETAGINISRELAKLGFDVTVYNDAETEGKFEKVRYRHKDFAYELEGKKLDILVSYRTIGPLLNQRLKAKKKFLWLQDLPDSEAYFRAPEAAIFCEKFLILSNFQKQKWLEEFHGIPKEKYFLTRNGVDDKLVAKYKNTPKKKFKFVYTTTPFRGLEQLLQIWPKIEGKLKGAELHLFGGMAIYGMSEGQFAELYKKAAAMKGVFVHGALKQEDLYKSICDAYLYLYPCVWPETSCISAMESISLGIPIIASDLGALPETIKPGCGVTLKGDAKSAEFQEGFAQTVVEICTNGAKWRKMHETCLKQDYSWESVASQWKKELF